MNKSRSSVKAKALRTVLRPDQSQELLQRLHILTRHGNLNADSLRKLKQVNHLLQLMEDAVSDLFSRHENPVIVDVGAGKSYLGLLFYEAFLKTQEKGQVLAIEERVELAQNTKTIAEEAGFSRYESSAGKTLEVQWPERVHLVCALHACDTATDDALIKGIQAKADYIVLVPCCQAQVARQLQELQKTDLSLLWDFPIHRREFGSHLTNVIRTLVLESYGYQVSVTELVGWEHSFKNELILAKRTQSYNDKAKTKLKELIEKIPVSPDALKVLHENSPSV